MHRDWSDLHAEPRILRKPKPRGMRARQARKRITEPRSPESRNRNAAPLPFTAGPTRNLIGAPGTLPDGASMRIAVHYTSERARRLAHKLNAAAHHA